MGGRRILCAIKKCSQQIICKRVENKNPNRPKGRGIFNVGNPIDKRIESNPTVASDGVFPTNETTRLAKKCNSSHSLKLLNHDQPSF